MPWPRGHSWGWSSPGNRSETNRNLTVAVTLRHQHWLRLRPLPHSLHPSYRFEFGWGGGLDREHCHSGLITKTSPLHIFLIKITANTYLHRHNALQNPMPKKIPWPHCARVHVDMKAAENRKHWAATKWLKEWKTVAFWTKKEKKPRHLPKDSGLIHTMCRNLNFLCKSLQGNKKNTFFICGMCTQQIQR